MDNYKTVIHKRSSQAMDMWTIGYAERRLKHMDKPDGQHFVLTTGIAHMHAPLSTYPQPNNKIIFNLWGNKTYPRINSRAYA